MKRTELPNGWHMVDDRDLLEVEDLQHEPPVSLPFPRIDTENGPSDVEDVLRAADEACRRMEVLARELECFGDFGGDDGPRAA
ncbi:MAG: hypothetical protein CMJ51_06555 [Planctomycetaceae bacterium]|nr:hypothetical protein [Planctomycetaceae bacterium]